MRSRTCLAADHFPKSFIPTAFVLGVFLIWGAMQCSAAFLQNGLKQPGNITVQDVEDSWTFIAQAGQSLLLRMGTADFNPRIQLLDPNNAVVKAVSNTSSGGRDAELVFQVQMDGTYTALVSSHFPNGVGSYVLTLALSPGSFEVGPGDEGGGLINGNRVLAVLDVGDLDLWSIPASSGDSMVIRMGATGYNPQLRLYGPTGLLVGFGFNPISGGGDAELNFQAKNSGPYTLVVSSYYNGGSGPYQLTLAQFPGGFLTASGDQGGALTSGELQRGILEVGDLDLWSFPANDGEGVVLRMGATGYNPHLRLYGPSGLLVASSFNASSGGRDAELSIQVTNSGVYTVVVASYYAGGNGPYLIALAHAGEEIVTSPGDEGGALVAGVQRHGRLEVGDLDLWSFSADAGDRIRLHVDALDTSPQMRVYGPEGALVASGFDSTAGSRDVDLVLVAKDAGSYLLVVGSYSLGGEGDYTLTLARLPGAGLIFRPPILAGELMRVQAIGGAPLARVVLLSATNLTTRTARWIPLVTNQLDASGVFTHSVPFQRLERERYYQLVEP